MRYNKYSFKDYQGKADKLLNDYNILNSTDLPVDPELLLRKLGYVLVPHKNLKCDYGIKGCVIKYNSKLQVHIDEYHYENQTETCLFTIGEEIGHIVLHLNEIKHIESIEDWNSILKENYDYHKYI